VSEITELIRTNIIETRPREKANVGFTDTSSLVDTGILDSVGVFTLVAFLEQHFGIEIPDADLEWKNFETVAAIARLVESKLAAAASSVT
jgi:acyl carrier protein